jgi:hypothetical protein
MRVQANYAACLRMSAKCQQYLLASDDVTNGRGTGDLWARTWTLLHLVKQRIWCVLKVRTIGSQPYYGTNPDLPGRPLLHVSTTGPGRHRATAT